MVKEAIDKVWKTKAEVSISLHSSNSFVFKFGNSEDKSIALEHGAFNIGGRLFVVRPWSPFIENSIAEMKTTSVWVLIYNVPLHLWNNLGLGPIASFVGIPLMMDEHTINQTRLSYARVLVEINFDCKFPTFIPLWMDGKFIMNLPVEYQWKPQKCISCSSFGHSSNTCSLKKAKAKLHWTPKKKHFTEVLETQPSYKEVAVEKEKEGNSAIEKLSMISNPTHEHHKEQTTSVVRERELENVTENCAHNEDSFIEFNTYVRRNKRPGKQGELNPSTPICLLNPYTVLDSDVDFEELLKIREEVSRTKQISYSSNTEQGIEQGTVEYKEQVETEIRIEEIEESCNGEEDIPIKSLPVILGKPTQENVLEGTVDACGESSEDEDTSEISEYETEVEEMSIKKIKPLVEIRRKSPTKEQHMAKLMDGFKSLVKLPTTGRETEMKNIFGDITDRFKGTRADKDLGPCDEKLGRGKRTPAKKNI